MPSGTSHARGASSAQDEEPLEDPVGDPSSGSEAERLPECVLCQKSIANPAELSTSGTSRATFHRHCLNAQLYFERHARSRTGSAALNKYKVEKPREFRYKVLELLTTNASSGSGGSGRRRGAQDRSRIIELCEEISQYANVYHQRSIFMLGERAFKQWCRPIVSVVSPWSGSSNTDRLRDTQGSGPTRMHSSPMGPAVGSLFSVLHLGWCCLV